MAGSTLHLAGQALSWGYAGAPLPNERESGDRCVVRAFAEGVLIAAVDGSGHGAEAALAASVAATTLEACTAESPIALVLRCHEELKRTRGAVMTLAFVHLREQTLTWLGVGNVDAVLFRIDGTGRTTSERVLLRPGVVGYQLPALRAEVSPLKPFDTLVMATDGIQSDFADGLAPEGDPQGIAEHILARHWKRTDDALVVVVRYLGGAPP